MHHKSRKLLKNAAVLLLWLAVWQLAALAVGQELLLPSPVSALSALFEFVKTADFWNSVLWSMIRIVSGYFSAIIVGITGGILSARFSLFRTVFSPILHLIRAVPVASFIILALVWIKSSSLPAFISFLMVLPMIWGSVESSINGIDEKYLEMAKVFRLSSLKILFQIKIPLILPSIISTAITSLGFAWKSGIAAEVICRPLNSLGRMLQDSKLYLDTPRVFAVTVVVALLSLLLEVIVKLCVRRFSNDIN